MSKSRRKKHAAKRRHQAAAGLLGQLAGALTACDRAGLRVRLRHGIVMSPYGYVFPLKGHRWVARTRAGGETGPAPDDMDD